MVANALDSEYENGVADVLAFVLGPTALVERNVFMSGRLSGAQRQIDVRVTGPVLQTENATLVVDSKRYNRPLDLNDVGCFLSLMLDVGADLGFMVSPRGASSAARQMAENSPGVWLQVLSLDDLASWSPRGTYSWTYALPQALEAEASRALRRAGFRVRPDLVEEWRGDIGAGLTAFRHFGMPTPDSDVLLSAQELILVTFHDAGVAEPIPLRSGVVAGGGTPGHRWLRVTLAGQAIDSKILAADEEDIARELDGLAGIYHVDRALLDVQRPDVWPIPVTFPKW